MVKKYKTFLATYKPVGGVIRVVLVREPDRWVAYFSTDPDLSVASILETVADRSALEQVFHDVKEVHGAGQQQLRDVWANVGAWNLIGWWHTLVELWAWDRPQSRLRDRSDSPWDKPERRPSHANRCQELRREALQEEYSSLPSVGGLRQKSAGSFSAYAPSRMRLTVLGKCSVHTSGCERLLREIPGQDLSGDLRQEQIDTEHQPLEELPMFRSMSSRPAVFRMLRSSPVPARPPRRARHHTFRCLPLEQLEERSVPSVVTIPVSSLADSGGGTLREAITTADQGTASNSYVINIVTPGTITLESVLPDLSRNITITGLGASTSTVQRDPAASPFRIFTVDRGETVNISGLTIAGGNAASGTGGGLDNFGTLAVSNSVFSGNSAVIGGGLDNERGGTATVSDSSFTSNSAVIFGGGLFNSAGLAGGGLSNFGTATVSGSSFTSNSAGTDGGGLGNFGTATVSGSSFTSNSASFGGGLANERGGTATVSGSTFTSNSAGTDGGGLVNFFGTATVSGSTFTSNSAGTDGGGLANEIRQ